MNRTIKTIKDSAIYTTGQLIYNLFGLLFYIIVINGLPIESIGVYFLIISIVNLFSIITTVPISKGLVRYIPFYKIENKEELSKQLFWNSFIIVLIIGLILSASFFVKDIYTFIYGKKILEGLGLGAALLTMATILNSIITATLSGLKKFKEISIIRITNGTLRLIAGILIVYVLKLGVGQLLIAISLAMLLSLSYGLIEIIKRLNITKPKLNKKIIEEFKEIIKFSISAGISGIIATIVFTTDITLLGIIRDNKEIGAYGMLFVLSKTAIVLVASLLASIALPNLTELLKSKEFESYFRRIYKIIVGIEGVIGLTFLFLAKRAVEILFPKYSAYSSLLIIFSGFTIYAITLILETVLMAKAQRRKIIGLALLVGSINIILDIPLIYLFGAYGAAIASISSLLIGSLYLYKITDLKISTRGVIAIILFAILGLIIGVIYGLEQGIVVVILYATYYYLFEMDKEDDKLIKEIIDRIIKKLTF